MDKKSKERNPPRSKKVVGWPLRLCCPFPNLACCCQAGGHQAGGRGNDGERADTKSRASSKGAALPG